MNTAVDPNPSRFQQPPTASGVEPTLDWAVFITLLFFIVVVGFRQILKAGNADQKVNEQLIQELLATNRANSSKLTEIAVATSQRESEDDSTIFRLRSTEQKLDALHRRLDLSGAPSSHPYQQPPQPAKKEET